VRSTARNASSANAHAAPIQRSRALPARGETGHLSKTFSGYKIARLAPQGFPGFFKFGRTSVLQIVIKKGPKESGKIKENIKG